MLGVVPLPEAQHVLVHPAPTPHPLTSPTARRGGLIRSMEAQIKLIMMLVVTFRSNPPRRSGPELTRRGHGKDRLRIGFWETAGAVKKQSSLTHSSAHPDHP